MKNFRTYDLAVNFYLQTRCQKLPAHLQSQLDRAAESIALNLAEGRGRSGIKEQLRFFYIALGSLRECQCILDLALPKNSLIWETADTLGAHLYRLIKSYD